MQYIHRHLSLVHHVIKTLISKLVHTTCFWNNPHQVRPIPKEWKLNEGTSGQLIIWNNVHKYVDVE